MANKNNNTAKGVIVQNTKTIEERIADIREKWFLIDPAYFMTLCTHTVEINPAMKCPIACGQGKLYIHPVYYNDKPDKFLEESMKVEIIRILLKHPYQRQMPNPVKMLLASNMTIANNTDFSSVALTKSYNFFGTSEFDKESMEAIYSAIELPEMPGGSGNVKKKGSSSSSNKGQKGAGIGSSYPDQSGSGSNSNSSAGGSNSSSTSRSGGSGNNDNSDADNTGGQGSGQDGQKHENSSGKQGGSESQDNSQQSQGNDSLKNFDDGCNSTEDALERTQFWKEDEFYYESINNVINKIESSGGTGWGTMPGNVVDEIKKSMIPKFDYKSVFRRVRSTIPSSKRSCTRMRPNRRFGYDAMGSKRECTTKILVAVDTSGSISDKELELALGFILGFFKTNIESIWQIHWDTQVYPESFKELTKKTVKAKGKKVYGRGGTDCSVVFSALQDKGKKGFLRKEKFNLCIIITDGEFGSIPEEYLANNYNRTKYLFCLNNKQNYQRFKKQKEFAKFGPCTFVDEKI